ncbi:uncharacterized protein LOC114287493 [Camellia sinensis]|uniref:uncharacterized protein LOC114287493 n=1 Tax=Camellia sinensis TaxID=4442 RepID=UPI001035845C|nr:uncharacterized protein LOC114287493 [Camellia sinensis]
MFTRASLSANSLFVNDEYDGVCEILFSFDGNYGTPRDLSKGGRDLCLDQIEPFMETPIDIKPSIIEGENFYGNLDNPGMPDDPSKAVTGETGSPINPDEEIGGNGWNIVRGASKDYILNFWIYFVIGFCYEFASLESFLELHV